MPFDISSFLDSPKTKIHKYFTTLLKNVKEKHGAKEPPSPPESDIDSDDSEAYEAREKRRDEIKNCTSAAVLEMVNQIYVKKDVNLLSSFVKNIEKFYENGIDNVDFMKPATIEVTFFIP